MFLKKAFLELPEMPFTMDLEVAEIYWIQAHQVAQRYGVDSGLIAFAHALLNSRGYLSQDEVEKYAFDSDLSGMLNPEAAADWLRMRARFLQSCREEGYGVRDPMRVPDLQLIAQRGNRLDELDMVPREELN